MDKQKLYGLIMVPIAALAIYAAWRSYNSTLSPHAFTAGGPPGGGGRPGGGPGGPGGGGGQRGPTPAQMLDETAKAVALTPEQKTKVQAIQEDLAAKRKAMPQTLSRDDRRKQMTANLAEADKQIKAILTPDQQVKYEALQARRRARMQGMRGGGPGGGMGGSGGGMGGSGGGMGGSGGRMGGPRSGGGPMAPPGGP